MMTFCLMSGHFKMARVSLGSLDWLKSNQVAVQHSKKIRTNWTLNNPR